MGNGLSNSRKTMERTKTFIKSERASAEVSKRIYKIFEEYDADDWGYQLQDKESLFYTYMKLNEPEEFKELMEEMYE